VKKFNKPGLSRTAHVYSLAWESPKQTRRLTPDQLLLAFREWKKLVKHSSPETITLPENITSSN
jgi:hypothetical protein